MKTLKLFLVAAALASAGCTSANLAKDSGTRYMADALAPWVEKGELPGAVSILYKDGVQETACIGYADVDAKRPVSLDNVYMQSINPHSDDVRFLVPQETVLRLAECLIDDMEREEREGKVWWYEY